MKNTKKVVAACTAALLALGMSVSTFAYNPDFDGPQPYSIAETPVAYTKGSLGITNQCKGRLRNYTSGNSVYAEATSMSYYGVTTNICTLVTPDGVPHQSIQHNSERAQVTVNIDNYPEIVTYTGNFQTSCPKYGSWSDSLSAKL